MKSLNQRQKAKLHILGMKAPFTALDMESKAIPANVWREAADDLDLLCCTKHVGSGNFRVLYFPLMWLPDRCYVYMDQRVKKGKSKVIMRAAKSGKAYQRGDTYNLQEFSEKLARLGLHEVLEGES